MRIVIFTYIKPVLAQTWLLNELDLLEKAGAKFQVYTHMVSRNKIRQSSYQKFKNSFFCIPICPRKLSKLLEYFIIHMYLFFLKPVNYTRILIIIIKYHQWIFLRDFFKLGKVLPKIVEFNPNILYTHYAINDYIFALFTSIYLNKKVGFVLHSTYPYPSYASILNQYVDFIIVKSKQIRNDYLNRYHNINLSKIYVLPWGIDTDYFDSRKEDRQVKLNKLFTLFSISRYVEMKGLIYLLQACNLLRKEKVLFQCIFVGYGYQKRIYMDYVNKYKLRSYVKILSGIPHSSRLKQILASNNLFILPAIKDSNGMYDFIPNAVLEAMAMKKVVITTKVTGMQEIARDGESIIFCKEKDPTDLVEKIRLVMDLPEEKRQEIGRKAREIVVSRYDKWKQGRKFLRFLESVMYNK